MTDQATPSAAPATPAAPAQPPPAVDTTPTQPWAHGQPPVQAPPPDVQHVEELAPTDAAPADAAPTTDPAPPPEESWQDKLARARLGADKAKRQRTQRQREAEEAQRVRLERDQLAQQAMWERQRREEAERQAAIVSQIRDPQQRLAAMQQLGVDPRDLAQDAVNADTPEGRIKMLEHRLEQRDRQMQEWREQQAAREEAQRQAQAEADFLRGTVESSEDHPILARMAKNRPDALRREANWVAAETFRRTGRYPSFEQIRAYLEGEYSKALRTDDRPTRDAGTQQSSRAAPPATAGQPASPSRTITQRASERAQLPKSVDEMTREEHIAYFAAQLREQARTG